VLDVLRLGAHQLLRTRIPQHAAVSATVDLARRVLSAGPVAFVNAVLRKVAAKDLPTWVAQLAPSDDRLAALALEHSHPTWIASAFRDALGGDLWQTGAALAADDTRPEVHLVARRLPASSSSRPAAGTPGPGRRTPCASPRATPARSPPCSRARPGCRTRAASSSPRRSRRRRSTGPTGSGSTCAPVPGGKAALLDVLAAERGATLVALEAQHHRARLVRRSGVTPSSPPTRGRPPLRPARPTGCCSTRRAAGLGALRRRPEARWRRQPGDLPGLMKLQGQLLTAGVELLRPGGLLAYVTCSPHLAETVVPVGDVLRRQPELEQVDARPLLPGVPDLGDGPTVQLWPHLHGTDAMFLALLRRRA
jgi:16S rRNA (cytosine967-C5)-methyltransferase